MIWEARLCLGLGGRNLPELDSPIDVNITFGKREKTFSCSSVKLNISFDDVEKKTGAIGRFYNCFNFPVIGWYRKNNLYFTGEFSDLEAALSVYEDLYDKEISLAEPVDTELSLSKVEDIGIISNLLSKQFTSLAIEKKFIGDFKTRTLICTPLVKDEHDPLLVHDGSFFEAARYRIMILPQGISLQLDPVIRIFIKKDPVYKNESLISTCDKVKCPQYMECVTNLPKSVVLYVGDDPEIEGLCTEVDGGARVYNPWTATIEQVPKYSLRGRPNSRMLYTRARMYALKTAKKRWTQTRFLFEKLCIDDELTLQIGEGKVTYSSPFLKLPIAQSPTTPYSSYAIAGEVSLTFGDGLEDVDPFQGLKKYGAFSSNKSDSRFPHPNIRVFCIYPESAEMQVTAMLEKLQSGHYYYPGFHLEEKPFRTEMNYFKHPISSSNSKGYSSQVKARLDNIRLDYPARSGDVYLIVLPDDDSGYYELKDFAINRNLKTQMVLRSTVEKLISDAYTLYCFALSISVAVGLTPWIVDSSYFDDADCYIGLAFSRQERFGDYKFYVGVADVFDSFGDHLSFALHEGKVSAAIRGLHVDKKFMEELVSQSIRRYHDKMNSPPDTIVIHKPGSFLPDEASGVADALLEWGSSRALMVHVQHNSLFRAYNPQFKYNPVATSYFRIGSGNAIIFPTGFLQSSSKDHKMGTPKPVQLNVKEIGASGVPEYKISDNDMHFIIQNYLAFTRLRWSSLSSRIRDPITIHAPRVVAEWQGKGIEGLDGIDVREVL